jgi:hypothetical protein
MTPRTELDAAESRSARASLGEPVLAWHERLDLLVQALAQLPDDVRLEVDAGHSERPTVELLASAYGLDHRVSFVTRGGAAGRGVVVRSNPPESPIGPPATSAACTSMAELVESLSRPDDPAASLQRGSDEMFRGQRIALVTNFAAHYRLPLFEQISERLQEAGACFRVVFSGARARSRPWLVSDSAPMFDHSSLRSIDLPLRKRPPHFPLALRRELRSFGPTVILSAGFSPFVTERVARVAAGERAKWGLWSGETEAMKTAASRLRYVQRRAVVSRADFAVAYGHAAASYLRTLRPTLPIVYGRNTAPLPEARERNAKPRATVELVTIGDLTSRRKGVDLVLDALGEAPDLDCGLTVVGGGKLLRRLSTRAAGDPRVRFTGALPPAATRRAVRAADILLFPTRSDVFGLVLVEAMGSGAAVIASTAPGAIADLAVPDHNCVVVPESEPRAWARAISRLIADQDLRLKLGARASAAVRSRWTIDHAADAMVAGLRLGLLAGGRARTR